MPVTVYPRLGDVLRRKNLTVAELERQIEQRYGVLVDRKTLHRLTYPEPIERVDLEVSGAVAAVLGVGLGELFEVEAVALGGGESGGGESGELMPEESSRLSELFDQQSRRALRESEQAELDGLVAKYGQFLRERLLRARAQRERILLEEARARTDAELQRLLGWWRAVERDEGWRRRLASRVRGRRSRRSA
ncbi:MAG TPA: helix-turn-helix transcriptional regulator [Chloroflexota bacterium]|nr:helix-turn-helix transcriptional regulator [Chloroflexota bacterium]